MWVEGNTQQHWYVGIILDEKDNGLIKTDHLKRNSERYYLNLKRSQLNDI